MLSAAVVIGALKVIFFKLRLIIKIDNQNEEIWIYHIYSKWKANSVDWLDIVCSVMCLIWVYIICSGLAVWILREIW